MFIVLPIIPWGYYFQRPQQISKSLGELGERVYYVAPISTEEAKPFSFSSKTTLDNIIKNVFHMWVVTDDKLDIHNGILQEKAILELCHEITYLFKDEKEITLLVQHPAWCPLVNILKDNLKIKIIYDCMDDHSSFPNSVDLSSEEYSLIKMSDHVVVTSSLLEEKINHLGAHSKLISNGVDFNLFTKTTKKSKPNTNKRVGYIGSIKEWVDFKLIDYISVNNTEVDFDFIGTVPDYIKVPKRDNLNFLGSRDISELPNLISSFDVCIIPFLKTPLTEATDPVKLYEYLSQGKPVVSTSLRELKKYSNLIYIADNHLEFNLKLRQALDESNKSTQHLSDIISKRIEFSKLNDWQNKAKSFINLSAS